MKKKKLIITAVVSSIALVAGSISALSFTKSKAASVLTENATGQIDGYDYELWKDNGNTSMSLNGGSTFSCNWSNINNALFRIGKKLGSNKTYQQLGGVNVSYDADYNPQGNSYLCVYGWTQNPLIEYYIVDSWGTWRPPGSQSKGQINVDAGTYDVYETTRNNQPSIEGNKTFQQYWSVRTQKRNSGSIDVAKHFAEWEKLGMRMGNMYEVALTVEGYQSSGSANVKKNDIVIGQGQNNNNQNNNQNNNANNIAPNGLDQGGSGGQNVDPNNNQKIDNNKNDTNNNQNNQIDNSQNNTNNQSNNNQNNNNQNNNSFGGFGNWGDFFKNFWSNFWSNWGNWFKKNNQSNNVNINNGTNDASQSGTIDSSQSGQNNTNDNSQNGQNNNQNGQNNNSNGQNNNKGDGMKIDTSKKLVAFAFDDGPVASASSDKILNALKNNNATATFFYIGNKINAQTESEIKRANEQGCEVANHTFTHPYLTNMSQDQIKSEINQTSEKLKALTGKTNFLLRPPYLATNQTVNQAVGCPLVTCSIDTGDWNNGNYDSVLNNIKKAQDGDILLMHENYDFTAQAVEAAIPYLKQQGFEIVSVSKMFEARNKQLVNGTVYTKCQ